MPTFREKFPPLHPPPPSPFPPVHPQARLSWPFPESTTVIHTRRSRVKPSREVYVGDGTLLSHCCHTVVALFLHCCCTVVTLFLHCFYTVVTLLLHCCWTVVTLLSQCCYTVVTLLPRAFPAIKRAEHRGSHPLQGGRGCCYSVVTVL
jgi:hypothetical protein